MNSKYLKYALGEILLVVVGILIALWINNWNEERKENEFETKMLNELYKTLEADEKYITEHLLGYRNQTTINAVKYFKDLLMETNRDKDSLRYYFDWLSYGLTFQLNSGPYESLKSIGLEKISNDSLRNEIVYFYDFVVPRLKDLIEFGQSGAEEDAKLKKSIMGSFEYQVNNKSVSIDQSTPSLSKINDSKFLELIYNAEFRSHWTKRHFEELLTSLTPLKENIFQKLQER
jgi:hypothetical protein